MEDEPLLVFYFITDVVLNAIHKMTVYSTSHTVHDFNIYIVQFDEFSLHAKYFEGNSRNAIV